MRVLVSVSCVYQLLPGVFGPVRFARASCPRLRFDDNPTGGSIVSCISDQLVSNTLPNPAFLSLENVTRAHAFG